MKRIFFLLLVAALTLGGLYYYSNNRTQLVLVVKGGLDYLTTESLSPDTQVSVWLKEPGKYTPLAETHFALGTQPPPISFSFTLPTPAPQRAVLTARMSYHNVPLWTSVPVTLELSPKGEIFVGTVTLTPLQTAQSPQTKQASFDCGGQSVRLVLLGNGASLNVGKQTFLTRISAASGGTGFEAVNSAEVIFWQGNDGKNTLTLPGQPSVECQAAAATP